MIGGTSQRAGSNTAAAFAGSVRGTFSSRPPPVTCAIDFTSATARIARTSCRYEGCGASSASPNVAPPNGAPYSSSAISARASV